MKVQWLLTGLLFVLAGCNSSSTPSSSETPVSSSNPVASGPVEVSPAASPTPSQPTQVAPTSSPVPAQPVEPSPASLAIPSAKLSPPASNAYRISNEGIGSAKVGMTLGELKKSLAGKAQFQVKSPFIVDFDAIAVVQGGKEQYYILYPAGMPLADSDVIEAIVTDNPNYRTAQGVGPGTAIAQAEAVYGQATLSHNTMNESREYVKFANPPSEDIAFRTKAPAGEPVVGIYPSSNSELKETKKFEKTAAIGLVEIYCRQNCPLPSP
ncbi:MAG: hypothetical protein AB1589_31910 [Cyanobacteriota bacterium]